MPLPSVSGRYTLYTVDRNNAIIGEMDSAVLVSAVWELNKPGSIQYNINPLDRAAVYPQECINEVMLMADDVWQHQAIHMKSADTPVVSQFDCPGLLEYFDYRFVLNGTLTYATTEQMAIAADLAYKAQNLLAGQDWNIVNDSYTASGVIRSLEYPREQHQNILGLLQQFNSFADAFGNPTGFDINVGNKNDSHRYFQMFYPHKGSTQTNLVLEWGRNVTDYTINTDGSKMCNRMYEMGGSSGGISYENNYQDDTSRGTYGEWQGVEHAGSEVDVTVLLSLAQRSVAGRKAPVKLPVLTTVEIPDALLGVVQTGDVVTVRIDHGRDYINSQFRIMKIEWHPGPGNLLLTVGSTLI